MCQTFYESVDKSLKSILTTHERKDILESYEKIMLDEHFTNLYAPRNGNGICSAISVGAIFGWRVYELHQRMVCVTAD